MTSRRFFRGEGIDLGGNRTEGFVGPTSVMIDDYCKFSTPDKEDAQNKAVVYEALVPVHYGMDLDWPSGPANPKIKDMEWDSIPQRDTCEKPKKETAMFQYRRMSDKVYSQSGVEGADSESSSDLILNEKCYWIAPPNQEYMFSVTQKLTRYPAFLRDEEGNPINDPNTKKYSDYLPESWYDEWVDRTNITDIRDHCFSTIERSNGRLFEKEVIEPYTKSCEKDSSCSEDHNDSRRADVNPAYRTGDETTTLRKEMKFNYADAARLNQCGIQNIQVFPFKARPYVWVSQEMTEDALVEYLNGMEWDSLMKLLAPGQFLFYTCHLQGLDKAACSHQASYAYTFGFCLNDQNIKKASRQPAEGNDDIKSCYFAPNFSTNSAKIYATPKASLIGATIETVTYPGSVLVNNNHPQKSIHGDSYCMYLGGRVTLSNGYPNSVNEIYKVRSEQWKEDLLGIPLGTRPTEGTLSLNYFDPSDPLAGHTDWKSTVIKGMADDPFEDDSKTTSFDDNPINIAGSKCGGTVMIGIEQIKKEEHVKTQELQGTLHTYNSATMKNNLFGPEGGNLEQPY